MFSSQILQTIHPLNLIDLKARPSIRSEKSATSHNKLSAQRHGLQVASTYPRTGVDQAHEPIHTNRR